MNRYDPLIGTAEILSLLFDFKFFYKRAIYQGIDILHDFMVLKVFILTTGPHPNRLSRAGGFYFFAKFGDRSDVGLFKRVAAQNAQT